MGTNWDTLIPPHVSVPKDYPDFPLTPIWDEMTNEATTLDKGIEHFVTVNRVASEGIGFLAVDQARQSSIGLDFNIDTL